MFYRDRLHALNELSNETTLKLKELSQMEKSSDHSESRHRRLIQTKLKSDFMEVLKNLSELQQETAKKEQEIIAKYQNDSDEPEDSSSTTQNEKIQMKEVINIDELRMMENNIRKLEKDIVDLNKIFVTLDNMIHDQGKEIDSIDVKVEGGKIKTDEARTELKQARSFQVWNYWYFYLINFLTFFFLFV